MNLPERILRLIYVTEDGCWIWTGYRNPKGYGHVRHNGRKRLIHRITYEEIRGPVPEGLELDHLCRVRECCNPRHLEAVTHAENVRRGDLAAYRRGAEMRGAQQRAKTHCPQGHPYSGGNLYVQPDGGRKCRECMREARRRYRERKRAA